MIQFLNQQHIIGNTNAVNGNGATALHLTVRAGKRSTVQELISNGADANIKNRAGKAPVSKAAMKQDIQDEIVQYLVATTTYISASKNAEGKNALHLAVQLGSRQRVSAHLHPECDINAVDNYQHTPLQYAIVRGEEGIISSLIASGAKLECEESDVVVTLDAKSQLLLAGLSQGEVELCQVAFKDGANLDLKVPCCTSKEDSCTHLYVAL